VKSFASAVVVSALLFGAVGLIRAEGASTVQPDNTRINARDRGQGSLTAGQQSEDKGDLELTRRVRKAVVADKSLSMLAKNVKIVSVNGIRDAARPSEHLRGQVNDSGQSAGRRRPGQSERSDRSKESAIGEFCEESSIRHRQE
jgi:hypothetical protein